MIFVEWIELFAYTILLQQKESLFAGKIVSWPRPPLSARNSGVQKVIPISNRSILLTHATHWATRSYPVIIHHHLLAHLTSSSPLTHQYGYVRNISSLPPSQSALLSPCRHHVSSSLLSSSLTLFSSSSLSAATLLHFSISSSLLPFLSLLQPNLSPLRDWFWFSSRPPSLPLLPLSSSSLSTSTPQLPLSLPPLHSAPLPCFLLLLPLPLPPLRSFPPHPLPLSLHISVSPPLFLTLLFSTAQSPTPLFSPLSASFSSSSSFIFPSSPSLSTLLLALAILAASSSSLLPLSLA